MGSMPEEDFEYIMAENLKMPRNIAGQLLIHHGLADWSDVFPRIDVPTLAVGCATSVLPPNLAEEIASHIPGAVAVVFSAEQRGSHFMFWENPEMWHW